MSTTEGWTIADPAAPGPTWDERLVLGGTQAVFQRAAWGEYRRRHGWSPHRWIAFSGGAPVMMVQVLVRRLPLGISVAWAPGGPVMDFPSASRKAEAAALRELPGTLADHLGPNLYLRVDSHASGTAERRYELARDFSAPLTPLTTGFTRVIDLDPRADLMASMSPKHRYYVKRALEHDVEWRTASDADAVRDLAALQTALYTRKGLERMRVLTPGDAAELVRLFGGDLVLLSGRDGGVAVTAALALCSGSGAFLVAAATDQRGRESGASYAALYRLCDILRARGIRHFDLGGTDPAAEGSGVDHFKAGFGASIVEYLGEWEWCRSRSLRWLINGYIAKRPRP